MILLFKTSKNSYGSAKGLKIDTTAKTYKCGYYTLTSMEMGDAIVIKNKDYENLITNCKENGFQKCVID